MRALLRVACVLVFVGSSATAEPQEGDAYLDKERGIALDIKASFGAEREKNLSAAADLYKTAATKGNARAQQLLANAYRHGRGVPQDKIWSAVWYLTAGLMCGANDFPLESRGFAADLSPGDWAHVVEIAETITLVRLFAQGLRPDCGEYYDGETWTGTVYPDRNNKNRDEFVAVSRTLDECRAKNSFRIMDAGWDNADHDCALNCRRNDSGLFRDKNTCKEVIRVAR